MGDGRDTETRGAVGIAPDIVAGTFSPDNVVGKRTLTGDVNAPTGNGYIDDGPYCETHARSDCFLAPAQRTRLTEQYGQLVDKAEVNYKLALTEIRFEKLLSKGNDDLPWFVMLMLDVAGLRAFSALASALKFLKAAQLSSLADAVDLDPNGARTTTQASAIAYQSLSMISDERLTEMSRGAVARGSAAAVAEFKAQLALEKQDKKAAALSFVERLKHAATIAYAELKNGPLAHASDAQLLVLWQAFDPTQHEDSIYKRELEAKLKRFESSGVDKIGRNDAWRPLDSFAAAEPVKRDVTVVRVRFKSGSPDRFAFAKKDWVFPAENMLPSERAPETDLPLDEKKWHGEAIPELLRSSARAEFDTFIDPEFIDVAIERHMQIWGKAPEVIEADDSNWFWDKDRVRRAREADGAKPSPFGIPRLQLQGVVHSTEQPIAIPPELTLKDSNP